MEARIYHPKQWKNDLPHGISEIPTGSKCKGLRAEWFQKSGSLSQVTSHLKVPLNSSTMLLDHPRYNFLCVQQSPEVRQTKPTFQRKEPHRDIGAQHWQRATVEAQWPQRALTRHCPVELCRWGPPWDPKPVELPVRLQLRRATGTGLQLMTRMCAQQNLRVGPQAQWFWTCSGPINPFLFLISVWI